MESIKVISGFSAIIGTFIFIILMTTLTIKLRKEKWKMVHDISESAPEKFRKRARFMMESNMSWIAGSAAGYSWLTYPMLRFLWRIKKSDLSLWRSHIQRIFGVNYSLYLMFIIFFNIGTLGMVIFIGISFLHD